MSEMHLKKPGFTNSFCGLIENKEKIKTRNSTYIHQNAMDKACSQHVMAYRNFNDFP